MSHSLSSVNIPSEHTDNYCPWKHCKMLIYQGVSHARVRKQEHHGKMKAQWPPPSPAVMECTMWLQRCRESHFFQERINMLGCELLKSSANLFLITSVAMALRITSTIGSTQLTHWYAIFNTGLRKDGQSSQCPEAWHTHVQELFVGCLGG